MWNSPSYPPPTTKTNVRVGWEEGRQLWNILNQYYYNLLALIIVQRTFLIINIQIIQSNNTFQMFWLFKLISWNFLRAGAERQHFSWLLVIQKGYKLLNT